jgi:hypothetical protein
MLVDDGRVDGDTDKGAFGDVVAAGGTDAGRAGRFGAAFTVGDDGDFEVAIVGCDVGIGVDGDLVEATADFEVGLDDGLVEDAADCDLVDDDGVVVAADGVDDDFAVAVKDVCWVVVDCEVGGCLVESAFGFDADLGDADTADLRIG